MRLAWRALWTRVRTRKIALLNRQRDYLELRNRPKIFALHRTLNTMLEESVSKWESYDYGEGYFYQGLPEIHVRGLRDTAARVENMRLKERLKGMSVLEIGCNTGFLSLSIAKSASRVVGFDINPFLIRIGQEVSSFLGIDNVELSASRFEDWCDQTTFDAVLSFANHSTVDQNTEQPISKYMESCMRLVRPGGTFLFESHPPQHEGSGLELVVSEIERLFDIKEKAVLKYGSFLDTGRTFIVAKRS